MTETKVIKEIWATENGFKDWFEFCKAQKQLLGYSEHLMIPETIVDELIEISLR